MTTPDLAGYFIAPNYDEYPTLWRTDDEHPDRPVAVIGAWELRRHLEVWEVIVAAVEAQDRCADCNAYLPDEPHTDECGEHDGAPDHQWQVTEPDAVHATGDEPADLLRGAKR